MRRAAVIASVAASYTLLVGILVLIVLALTTAAADGWKLRAAAATVAERSPGFSPDGLQIAFIRSGLGRPQLWVMDADGSDPQPLARATRFSWAGHSGSLLFTRGGRRVFRIDAGGGLAVSVDARLGRLVTRSQRRLVFVRDGHLHVRDANGATWQLT